MCSGVWPRLSVAFPSWEPTISAARTQIGAAGGGAAHRISNLGDLRLGRVV